MFKDSVEEEKVPSTTSESKDSSLYPSLNSILTNATSATRGPQLQKNTQEENKKSEVLSQIFLILLDLKFTVNPKAQIAIKEFVSQHHSSDIAVLFLGLYTERLIEKDLLIALFTQQHPLSRNMYIKSWWDLEKNTIRVKYQNQDNNNAKQSTSLKLKEILSDKKYEQQLIAQLKHDLTKYARENFYTYKSGNTYYYSPNPNEESIGGRCDQEGKPLQDEFGNELTDDSGNFKYALIELVQTSEDTFTENKRVVPQETEGATALTDSEGVSLATKYRELIKKDKPKNTPKTRAEAVNYLFQLIDVMSADEIFRYINTPNFQYLIGSQDIKLKLTVWKTDLKDICKQFCTGYQSISDNNNDNRLLDILLDEKIFVTLSNDQLGHIFLHQNPLLVADVVVNLYQRKQFSYQNINYAFLQGLLLDNPKILHQVNQKRCELKTKLLLPPDSRLPGKNNFESETLTKHQLFQYDDKTVAAIEQWIRVSFQDLIINSIKEGSLKHLNENAPYYFYQIPTNSYMLLSPKQTEHTNYYRYKNLKADLYPLVYDKSVQKFNKPVIFFGLINIDGIHYLPYFIHNNHGKVTVITVDPSPLVYPIEAQDNVHVDTKTETYKKLGVIFQDLLPGCEFFDPFLTQMLRERDCGPNSAQTITDALCRTLTSAPLLKINSEGNLMLDPDNLSIKGSPHGINPYSNTYVYPSSVEINSSRNRTTWQERLVSISETKYFMRPDYLVDQPLQILDAWEELTEDYSYLAQVDRQTLNDERNTNISAVQSILLSEEKGREITNNLITYYKQHLQLPSFNELASFIKSKVDNIQLQQYTSAHQNSLPILLEDLLTVILKDYIAEALEAALDQQLVKLATNPDLDAERIVAAFLNKHQSIYKKLQPHDQISISERLRHKTEKLVKSKLIEYHSVVVTEHMIKHGQFFLSKLSVDHFIESTDQLAALLIEQLSNSDLSFFKENDEKSIKSLLVLPNQKHSASLLSLAYLRTHDYERLTTIISTNVDIIAKQIFDATLKYALLNLNFHNQTLQDLLSCFDAQKMIFLSPPPQSYLPQEPTPNLLSIDEVQTALGAWIMPNLNTEFYQKIGEIFQKKIEDQVSIFIRNEDIANEIFEFSPILIDSWLNDNGALAVNFNFQAMIKKHGSASSITLEEYKHPVSYPIIQYELSREMARLLLKQRNEFFDKIARSILNEANENLTLENINTHFDLSLDLTLALFKFSFTSNKDLKVDFEKLITIGFNLELEPLVLNQCGNRFYQFFSNNYTREILNNHAVALAFIDQVNLAHNLIAKINMILPAEIKMMTKEYERELDDLKQSLSSLPLTTFFKAKLEILKRMFGEKIILALLNDLVKKSGYVKNELLPGAVTTAIRPLICGLLGIHTPLILTPETVSDIDAKIFTLLVKKELSVIIDSELLTLPVIKHIPNTYNQSLTPQMMIELIAYWFTNRSLLSNVKYLLAEDRLPTLISKLINLVNYYGSTQQPLEEQDLIHLKKLLPLSRKDRKEMLELFVNKDIISQISAALIKTKELAGGKFKPTGVTFTELKYQLRGEEVKSSKKVKPYLTQKKFNEKVIEIFNSRTKDALLKLHSEIEAEEDEGQQNINIIDIQEELYQLYEVEGKEEKPVISNVEFEQKVVTELRKRMREHKEATENMSAEEKKAVPAVNMSTIRNELKQQYTIQVIPQKEEEEDKAIIVPREQLKRRGLNSYGFFGNTPLDKELSYLEARHTDDQLDEWDFDQIRLQLRERWYGIVHIEKNAAPWNHYLNAKPDYRDSEYIFMASKLAKFYQKNGEPLFIYDLLMPEFFTPSANLREQYLPTSIAEEMNQVANSQGIYDIENTSSLNIDMMTIDDIPLPNLVITRSGFALDINWVLRGYIKHNSLFNPYTKLSYTSEELDDILHHPLAVQLVEQVKANCVPHISRRVIDILEEYVKATVLEYGLSGNYNEVDQKKSEEAAAKFYDALRLIPNERKALYAELIPGNQNQDTVETILKKSAENCITYQGLQLARLVIAYKGESHTLASFIADRAKLNESQMRSFANVNQALISDAATESERYILKISQSIQNTYKM